MYSSRSWSVIVFFSVLMAISLGFLTHESICNNIAIGFNIKQQKRERVMTAQMFSLINMAPNKTFFTVLVVVSPP